VKGIYVLIIHVAKDVNVNTGALGRIAFKKGLYAYVGSAQTNLEQRIKRHVRSEKRLFWHIDYLLDRAIVIRVILIPGEERIECILARGLEQRLRCIPRFGSSDCNCSGHLFFAAGKSRLEEQVLKVLTIVDPTLCSHPALEPATFLQPLSENRYLRL